MAMLSNQRYPLKKKQRNPTILPVSMGSPASHLSHGRFVDAAWKGGSFHKGKPFTNGERRPNKMGE